MGKFLRFIALFLILGPVSAMFSEPFFESVYDRMGWDTEDFAGPFLQLSQSMTASPVFLPTALALIGAGLGVWLHYLATAFDRKRPSRQDKFRKLHREIVDLREAFWQAIKEDDGVYNFEAPLYDTNMRINALAAHLNGVGLKLKVLRAGSLADQRILLLTYLKILETYSKDGFIRLARQDMKKAFIEINEQIQSQSLPSTPEETPPKTHPD